MTRSDSPPSAPAILVLAEGVASREACAALVEAIAARVAAVGSLEAAGGVVAEHPQVSAVLADIRDAGEAVASALLERLEAGARAGAFGSVVLLDRVQIDLAAGLAPHADVALLCEPAPLEAAAALALAARRAVAPEARTPGPDEARLRALSDEIGRLARALAQLAEDGSARAPIAGVPSEQPSSEAAGPYMPSPQAIRAIIRGRRLRDNFFGADLFADPAWDMLLDLMAARLEGGSVAVSSLCIAAAVPATTALRWIKSLTEEGLLARVPDPHDGRRYFMALSERAVEAMTGYLAALDRSGLIGR